MLAHSSLVDSSKDLNVARVTMVPPNQK
jgi:hypothetical protein